MAQISIFGRLNSSEWVDNLPSYIDIKYKVINNKIGLLASAGIGLSVDVAYASEDLKTEDKYDSLTNLASELAESHTTNVKRINPYGSDWLVYARGEMGAAKGQMLSCPSTNLARLNINGSDVIAYDISEAMKQIGFSNDLYVKYDVNLDLIKDKLREIYLTDKNGMPLEKLYYEEVEKINSKIQNEILGDALIRTATVGTSLIRGEEPANPLDKAFLAKYLTKDENQAYRISIRTGDFQMVKKLTKVALEISKENKKTI